MTEVRRGKSKNLSLLPVFQGKVSRVIISYQDCFDTSTGTSASSAYHSVLRQAQQPQARLVGSSYRTKVASTGSATPGKVSRVIISYQGCFDTSTGTSASSAYHSVQRRLSNRRQG